MPTASPRIAYELGILTFSSICTIVSGHSAFRIVIVSVEINGGSLVEPTKICVARCKISTDISSHLKLQSTAHSYSSKAKLFWTRRSTQSQATMRTSSASCPRMFILRGPWHPGWAEPSRTDRAITTHAASIRFRFQQRPMRSSKALEISRSSSTHIESGCLLRTGTSR